MRMWVEILFNIAYLIVIWGLVITMILLKDRVASENRKSTSLVIWAFALLALGDTGHVGFRVLAYSMGGLESRVQFLGMNIGLVGIGALSTAITVTIFYILMLELWRVHFKQRYGWFEYLLIASAIFRLALMILPANHWDSVVPPQPWSIWRNLPLTLIGLGVAYLMLRDARRTHDRTFQWIGISILVSYACYIPVILFVQQVPSIGMLMIPKTLAYVAVGFLAYHDFYQTNRVPQQTNSIKAMEA